jgi:hypothetical protein
VSRQPKRLPSYPPVEGQLDVFEVLEMVEEEGLVPGKQSAPMPDPNDEGPDAASGMTRSDFLHGLETKLTIHYGDGYSMWVKDEHGEILHARPFWSQIECWAFIVGWERAREHF